MPDEFLLEGDGDLVAADILPHFPEIVSLAMATDSPRTMYENDILLDITEYVESYMPNYLAYLDKNPELKPLVQIVDEEGNVRYVAIYSFMDGVNDPWEGTCYRRDWVVKYAKPTEYVWDWESDYVKEHGHPEVTPLSEAVKEKTWRAGRKTRLRRLRQSMAIIRTRRIRIT